MEKKVGVKCVFCGIIITETEDMSKSVNDLIKEKYILEIKLSQKGKEIRSGGVCEKCANENQTIKYLLNE